MSFLKNLFHFEKDPAMSARDRMGLLSAGLRDLGANLQGGDGGHLDRWEAGRPARQAMQEAMEKRQRLLRERAAAKAGEPYITYNPRPIHVGEVAEWLDLSEWGLFTSEPPGR